MVGRAVGHTPYFFSAGVQAPAEVDFFHVGKEAAVESAYFIPGFGAYEQGGSCCPKHRDVGVILSLIGFDCSEYAAAAEGVAVAVDVATGGSGIFEHPFVGLCQELGLAGCGLGVMAP